MFEKLHTPKMVSVFLLSVFISLKSFAALNPGDVAFVALNSDAPDGFAFVLLADAPVGEQIVFTDNGWSEFDNDWYANSESHFIWTSPGLTAGSVVSIVETAPDVLTVTGGGTVGALLQNDNATAANFNFLGESIFAYQGTIGSTNPVFLAGINIDDNFAHNTGCDDVNTDWLISVADMQACASILTPTTSSTASSSLPAELTNGTDAVQIFPAPNLESDNVKYNGPTSGTAEFLKNEINDFTNWVNDNDFAYAIDPTDFPVFNVFPTLSVIASVDSNVSINGGTDGQVSAIVSGGASPYSYLWNNGSTSATVAGLSAGTYTVTVTDNNSTIAIDSATVTEPSALSVSTMVTNVSVNGGSDGAINATVSGAVLPYTYLWSNGATTEDLTNLIAGTYSITVTDNNGATATDTAVVNEPTALVATTVATDVTINGGSDGSIDATVTGGIAPYVYAWSNGATTEDITGLTAGTYTLTVTDANAATTTDSATVNEPTALVATTVATDVTINGGSDGSIDATVSGGVAPYTYAWSNGATTEDITGLTAGTYTLTVTDANAATTTDSATVNEPTALVATTVATDVTINGGSDGSIDATVSGGVAPYTYLWNNGATTEDITGLTAGTYTLTVTDANAATTTDSATVNEPAALVATTVATDVTINGGSDGSIDATVSGGVAPYVYTWSNGATTEDITGLTAGTYTLTVTDANAATTTDSATVNEPTALVATTVATDVTINGGSDGSIDATVSGGVAPYTYLWNNGATTEDITGLTAGTYTLTVTDANAATTTDSATVNEPGALVATTVATDVTINGGSDGSIDATVFGGVAPYVYTWSNGATTEDITGLTAGTYTLTVTDANAATTTDSATVNEPEALVATTVATDVTINGGSDGSIDASVSGGVAPYVYTWSNGATTEDITGLTAGTYTLTVTDANAATTTDSATVNEPGAVSVSTLVTDVSTNGGNDGQITATATGGVPPYNYLWSDGQTTATATGLVAGNYTVTATDNNGATATDTATVNEPGALLLTIGTVTDESSPGAADGAASVVVNGGVPPYTYLWSNGATTQNITGLSAGNYSVTVTDTQGATAVLTAIVVGLGGGVVTTTPVPTNSIWALLILIFLFLMLGFRNKRSF